MLLSPSYINILNMWGYSLFTIDACLLFCSYAFANLDDVRKYIAEETAHTHRETLQISWGTKQDTEVETDLGTVHRNANSQVDLEVSTDAADIDGIYDEALSNIKYRKPIVKANNGTSDAEKEQAAKDYYANVRTNVSSF